MRLSRFFPRLKDVGELRVIVTNGFAVSEFNSVIDGVELGQRSWNFNRDGKEFHLYRDKVKSARLFYGEHPRFKRELGEIDLLDAQGETGMMLFLDPSKHQPDAPEIAAFRSLIDEFGENPAVEEEEAAPAGPAVH